MLSEEAEAVSSSGVELSIEFPNVPRAGRPVLVRASHTGGPSGLLHSVDLRCRVQQGEPFTAESDENPLELTISTFDANPGDLVNCEAAARTSNGIIIMSEVASIELQSRFARTSREGQGAAHGDQRRRRRNLWIGVGVGGAAIVVVTVVLGVVLGTRPEEASIGQVELVGP